MVDCAALERRYTARYRGFESLPLRQNYMQDKTTTLQQLKDLEQKFIAERGWGKHHTSKNVAASIAIEAAELLEHFQWDEYGKNDKKEIEQELADVILYCLSFALTNKIDIAQAVQDKIAHNAKKYPVKLFNSQRKKYH